MSDEKNYNDMSIGDLTREAKTVYGLAITKSMNAEDIIKAIKSKQMHSGTAFATKRGDALEPGYARIKIAREDPNHVLGGNLPVYTQVNDYKLTIARGVEVDIPIKVLRVLENAVHRVAIVNDDKPVDANDSKSFQWVPRFPFTIIDINDGPDPKPSSWEQQRLRKLKPYLKFNETYGYWPRSAELKDMIRSGQFKLAEV
jgi:hypothetical protein